MNKRSTGRRKNPVQRHRNYFQKIYKRKFLKLLLTIDEESNEFHHKMKFKYYAWISTTLEKMLKGKFQQEEVNHTQKTQRINIRQADQNMTENSPHHHNKTMVTNKCCSLVTLRVLSFSIKKKTHTLTEWI